MEPQLVTCAEAILPIQLLLPNWLCQTSRVLLNTIGTCEMKCDINDSIHKVEQGHKVH